MDYSWHSLLTSKRNEVEASALGKLREQKATDKD